MLSVSLTPRKVEQYLEGVRLLLVRLCNQLGRISWQVIAMALYRLGVSTVPLIWSSLVGSGSPLWHCWLSLDMSSHPCFLVDTISDQLGRIHIVREERLHDHGRAMAVPETNYSTTDSPWECFRETFIVLNIPIRSADNILLYCVIE